MGKLFARITFFPSLTYNVLLEKLTSRNWYDAIDNRVILGALPFKSMTKQLVEKENVRAVISLNEPYELKMFSNMEKEWSSVGVSFLQLSTVDMFQAPSQEKLVKGVEFIEDFIKCNNEGRVYVHCKAGKTRSATLVACYLIKKYNWTPKQALSYVLEKRPHAYLGPNQIEAITTFYNNMKTPPS